MGERRLTHILGIRLIDGVYLRSLPPVELPWITTFNLRWWNHIEGEHKPHADEPETSACGADVWLGLQLSER
jgi:hypothetical protein